MKTVINNIIAILSLFAAVPTGWAIYAGTQKIPAFPMWYYASIAAGIAVVAVDVAAAMLVTDIRTFNQSLRLKGEQELFTMPTRQAWLILIGAVAAEIILGLVIVVIPSLLSGGVIVFPLLSLAGVFAFAVRADLQERESSLQELRVKKKQERKDGESQATPPRKQSKKASKRVQDADLIAYLAGNDGVTDTQVAQHFGVSRQAISQRRKKLFSVAKAVSNE